MPGQDTASLVNPNATSGSFPVNVYKTLTAVDNGTHCASYCALDLVTPCQYYFVYDGDCYLNNFDTGVDLNLDMSNAFGVEFGIQYGKI